MPLKLKLTLAPRPPKEQQEQEQKEEQEQDHIYCVCRQPDNGLPMVGCEMCSEWFHFACLLRLRELEGELNGEGSFNLAPEALDLALSKLPGGEYVCSGCRVQSETTGVLLAARDASDSVLPSSVGPSSSALDGQSASSPAVYCICRLGDTGETMVNCEACDEWFHVSCLGLPGDERAAEAAFACPICNHAASPPSKYSKKVASKKRTKISADQRGHERLSADEYDLDALRGSGSDEDSGTQAAQVPLQELLETRASKFSFSGVARRVETAFLSALTLEEDGFATPVFIPSPTSVFDSSAASAAGRSNAVSVECVPGAKFPSAADGFDVDSIVKLVGGARQFDVVQVRTQGEAKGPGGKKWTLGQWKNYFLDNSRGKWRQRYGLLNVLSLEVSDSRLMSQLESPSIVRELDWIANLWPQDPSLEFGLANGPRTSHPQRFHQAQPHALSESTDGVHAFRTAHTQLIADSVIHHPVLSSTAAGQRVRASLGASPKVRYYCLMGVKGGYTDWHIDFGGTSVWYHVVSGLKVFLLLPPTPANLAAYEKWSTSPTQNRDWLGDVPGIDTPIYIEQVAAGDTIMLPSGWIHAVYTPCDSLVFGGNFLHSLAMGMQAKIYEMEHATSVPAKFRFPHFEATQWLVVAAYIRRLREDSPRRRRPLNRWEFENLHQLLKCMERNLAQFESCLPRGLRAASLGDGSISEHGTSDALEMLQELRRLLSRAHDTEPLSAKHQYWQDVNAAPGPSESVDTASEITEKAKILPPWKLAADRNAAQGFVFSFEKLTSAIRCAELANRRSEQNRAMRQAKQEAAAAQRALEQHAQLAIKVARTTDTGEIRATAAVRAGGNELDNERLFSDAAAAFGAGRVIESDSSSDSEASSAFESTPVDVNRRSLLVNARKRAPPFTGEALEQPPKKARVAVLAPVARAVPKPSKPKGGVHQRLAKKLGVPLKRR